MQLCVVSFQELATVLPHTAPVVEQQANIPSLHHNMLRHFGLLSVSSVLNQPDFLVRSSVRVKALIPICCTTRQCLVLPPSLSAFSTCFSGIVSFSFNHSLFLSVCQTLNSPVLFSSCVKSLSTTSTQCSRPLEVLSMLFVTDLTLLAPRREGVEVLMADLQVPADDFSYGRSKIFIRNPRTVGRIQSSPAALECVL